MDKVFITASELLQDSFRLAAQIHRSGFRPDFIIGIWRGGTPVGIAIQEYFEYFGVRPDHIAVRTSAYVGIGERTKTIRVTGFITSSRRRTPTIRCWSWTTSSIPVTASRPCWPNSRRRCA